MTRHFSPPAPEATAVPAMLVDAARCWRDARDSGKSVQPCLARTLDAHDCTMLAPVLDSLYLFFEAALGRPMTVGEALALSDDEHLLLGLVDGSKPRRCLNCPRGAATALDCALCSTRIMLALTLGQPVRTLQ
ncbi:hypothetical protein O3U67_02815 [Brevundimonas diminuta]|uniref:hypothetical protein n=1 Tax=Brevundimonas diminuta TaxID=293 RepID=UPI0022AEA8D3|nr:hypothetical protein [Brevundimonas diminuta]MCZ4107006.1 hypothetical protein [Brevundimonas diminuta]